MFNFGFGGGGPGPSARRQEVDNNKFYETLGVAKTATADEIKKAFRKAAVVHHPDKGGDEAKFKDIQKAYEVLSDPEKRELYDNYGEEGVENGGPSMQAADIFDLFGGGGGRQRQGKRRGEDVVFPLKVSLEDLYNGLTKKLRLTKNIICRDCDGKGGRAESVTTCKGCKGRGVKVIVRQLGPGMIQQMQTFCNECQGEGHVIADKDKCKKCKGQRTTKEKKTLEVFIGRGAGHGDKITFRGEADEAPDTLPGDVVVVLQQKEHPVFKREGPNLIMKKHISLVEALCGFTFNIRHLDRRTLVVRSDPGVVYRPGDIKAILNEGMPSRNNPYQRGNLYVEFVIVFPQSHSLSDAVKAELERILPRPGPDELPPEPAAPAPQRDAGDEDADMKDTQSSVAPAENEDIVEEVNLVDVDFEAERQRQAQNERGQRQAYDEDEDQHRHAGPGCRSQ